MKNRFAFLVLLLSLACAGRPLLAAPPAPLFEIFTQRFTTDASDHPILDLGKLNARGEFTHYSATQLPLDTRIPFDAMNQNLLPFFTLITYNVLGPQALANFRLTRSVNVAGQDYFVLAVADDPKLDIGTALNLSARGTVSPGDPLIGGFVIDEHPRRVLLRGIGPSLAGTGVSAPLPDPILSMFRQGLPAAFIFNDDWAQQDRVGEIESAAASVGAFPLSRASKDAALILELPPGSYTVQLTSANSSAGTALLEVYLLP